MSDQARADSGMPMESALLLTWVEALQTRITAIEEAQFNIEVLRIRIMAIEEAMQKVVLEQASMSQGQTNLWTHTTALDVEQQAHGRWLESLGITIRENSAEAKANAAEAHEQLIKRIENALIKRMGVS